MKKLKFFLTKALIGFGLGGCVSVSALENTFPSQPLWVGENCSVTSTSSLEANGRYLQRGSLIYQALFESDGWAGEIRALSLDANGAISQQVWTTDSEFALASHVVNARTILTHNSIGVNFEWALLSEHQRSSFLDAAAGETLELNSEAANERLNWVRGSNESIINGVGALRERRKLLGDVINSNLLYVASQDYGYYYGPDTVSASAYSDYLVSKEAKVPLIFVGANDGMLHGFDATNGREKFAYVPSTLYPKLHHLWSPEYQGNHQFYVDGSPGVGDVYDGGWKTYIAGGLGYGGKGIFSLDVTDREFTAEDVLWERTAPASSVQGDWDNLGHIAGEPTIARTISNTYVTIFGNGYNSNDGVASLYIVNAKTGALIRQLNAPVIAGAEANGLSTAAAFVNSDGQVTYVYAGDLQGSLWKFDLSDASPSNWTEPLRPLFSAGVDQPITGQVSVVAHPEGGRLVVFGTGRYLFEGDGAAGPTQALYGIWDKDNTDQVVSKSNLLGQVLSATDVDGYRALSQNSINWRTHRGWYISLASGERVLSAPSLHAGRAIFTTFTPGSADCDGGESWVVGVNIWSGGRLVDGIFDTNNDRIFDAEDVVACGNKSCAPSAYRLPVGSLEGHQILFKVGVDSGYSSGRDGSIDQFDLRGSASGLGPGRMSWRQLR